MPRSQKADTQTVPCADQHVPNLQTARRPSCHRTNNVKALKETEITEPNQGKSPSGIDLLNHHHTTTILQPFFRDHPGEPVPEENFWTLWCKGRLTEADTLTIRLGATPSELTSTHFHHPHVFYRPDALPATQPTVSKHWRQLAHSDSGEDARVLLNGVTCTVSGQTS